MDISQVSAYRQAIEPSGRSAQLSAEIRPPEKFQPVPPIVEAGKSEQKVQESATAVRALALRREYEASTANAVASLVKPEALGYTSSGAVADAVKTVGNYISTFA